MEKKGFTLVELLAVIVIFALIALITIPVVLSVIEKSKTKTYERSIDAYGKSIEKGIAEYLIDHENDTGAEITIETLKNGKYIKYEGNDVSCEIEKIYSDKTIYLNKCKINNAEEYVMKGDTYYSYGKEQKELPAYSIGDQISYNNIEFRVLSDSPRSNTSVTLIKDTPLKKEEINQYGQGRINNYGYWTKGTADYDSYYNHPDGYGGMAYYSTEECGYINNTSVTTNCTLDFNLSDVGNVAKNWAAAKLNMEDLVEDSLGYKVRLITVEELINNFGYDKMVSVGGVTRPENPTDWISFGYFYWTMSKKEDSNYGLYFIDSSGRLNSDNVYNGLLYVHPGVRPVITIKKVSLQK